MAAAENLHYIADAAQAAYLGDHPERAAAQQQQGAPSMQQPGDYAGAHTPDMPPCAAMGTLPLPHRSDRRPAESRLLLPCPLVRCALGLEAALAQHGEAVRPILLHIYISQPLSSLCAGTTALGAPVEPPLNGEAAHGVPVDMRSQPAESGHEA